MNTEEVDSDETWDFTLEDTLEYLKEIREELIQEHEDLVHRTSNNAFGTLRGDTAEDEIRVRYNNLVRALLNNVHCQGAKDFSLPNTIHLRKTTVRDFEDTAKHIEKLMNSVEKDLTLTKKNIAYLENNEERLLQMRNACTGAVENVGSDATYHKEIRITKKLFNGIKDDLYTVVNTIFPDNHGFKDILAILTRAYTAGGDDVYIDVQPEIIAFVTFLVEADLAVYHRNDKRKIKMSELL